ncbi:MAG: ribosomal RNA small subunit methyltransferase A [Candidatus Brocadiaceae bacterium]|nr:ribosomal RNA small subunit methyltransferase A [Candidatus Brocadiaceae bacterium]
MPSRSAPPEPPSHPRDILAAHGLSPRKVFGQNFLAAPADLDRVAAVARLDPQEVVLEIGTGLGRLTQRLAAGARMVVSVEIDRGLHAVAAHRLAAAANVRLLCCDFLESKHRIRAEVTDAVHAAGGADGPLKVVSNLPYGISSPAIVNLLEWEIPVAEMCLMLQKEVADRVVARPGTRAYGPLTVIVGHWAEAERLATFPRHAFWPPPEVSSTLLRIARRPAVARTPDYDVFAAAVARLFQTRRKSLAAAVRAAWDAHAADRVTRAAGIDTRRRAEELTVAELHAVARALGPPERT